MSISRAGLNVNGERYQPMISAPDPTDVLKLTEKQLDEVYDMELNHGQRFEYAKSEFAAYVVPANERTLVEKAYMKLRLVHPLAKHIICSYSVPGLPRFQHEEYCDDNETGAGKFIMNMMKASQLTNVAVFVVRYQHGEKIGNKRFELMTDAIISAFNMFPFNKYTNRNQILKTIEVEKNSSVMQVVRSGGRGMRKPIRSSEKSRVRGGRNRGRMQHENMERNKRRRHESSNGLNELPTYNFSFPKPMNWSLQQGREEERNLGSSWPTLSQSNTT